MKSFNLFKRLGALLTAVAVLASMGTVAFATDAATVQITAADIIPVEGSVDASGEGLYEVTVTYTSEGVGDMGVTMLAYTGDLNDSQRLTIAYVTQEEPADSISFRIDTTGEDAIQVGKGEKIIILLGGDRVRASVSARVVVPWDATAEAALKNTENDDDFAGLEEALSVNLDSTNIEDALRDALAGYAVNLQDGNGNFAPVDWSNVTLNVEKVTGKEGVTHKATLTVDDTVDVEGVYNDVDAVYTLEFAAVFSGTADILTVTPNSFTVWGDKIVEANPIDAVSGVTEEMIEAAVAAQVKAATVKVAKNNTELEAVVGEADKESNITVEMTLAGDFNPENDTAGLEATVTLGEGTYGNVTVGAAGVTTLDPITVNYKAESPTEPWNPSGAEYQGEEIPANNVVKTEEELEVYIAGLLDGETVSVTNDNNDNAVITLEDDPANFEVSVSIDTGSAEGGFAPATATVTILEGTEGTNNAVVGAGGLEFTLTFQTAVRTYWTVAEVECAEGIISDEDDPKAADHDFTVYATEELNNKTVTIKDESGAESYALELITSGDDANCTVTTSNGAVAEGKATITVTVTLDEGTIEDGDTTITIPENITFTTTFESAIKTFTYGDINGDGFITTADLTALRRYLVSDTPDGFIEEAANIHNPETSAITTADLTALRRRLVDATMELPVVD